MKGEGKRRETRPERFEALARLPLFFALQGKRAVIAGGTPAAAWKAELLSAAGAAIDVYAGDIADEMLHAANDRAGGVVTLHRREWTAADLDGAALAVGDFRDGAGAAAFSRAARVAGVPVNIIDKPEYCDFSFGAIVNRSPLVIGISTDGAAPVFARAIRGKLEAILPHGFARWTAAAARWRGAVMASGLSFARRRKFWQAFTAHAVANPDQEPRPDDFDRLLAGAAGIAAATERGSMTVVGADCCDPGALTLRAIRALQAADAIVFDGQVPREVLDFARREARKIRLGATKHDGFRSQSVIAALSADLIKQGKHVVVVTSNRRGLRAARPLSSAA